MKKIVILGLVLSVFLCFAGCGSDVPNEVPTTPEDVADTQTDEEMLSDVSDSITDNNDEGEAEKIIKTESADVSEINLLDEMDASERREVNIFLSNFSEAHYSGEWDAASLISFAYIHNKLNNKSFKDEIYQIDGGSYMGLSKELANKTIDRFFGAKVESDIGENDHRIFYRDGMFLFPAADGEEYGYFAVAEKVTDLNDGTYRVEFNRYFAPDIFGSPAEDYYSYSVEEANANKEQVGSGTAVIRPKVYNGSDTYELVSYSLNY